MHIESIDLRQLRLIEALSESGSLTAAAYKLGLSQSAASHALARLRHAAGDQLFVRIGTGMRPTPYGHQLGETVCQALAVMRRGLDRRSDFDSKLSTRSFNVCMSDVGQLVLLPRLIEQIESEAPNISIRICPVPSDHETTKFESGDVDLAIGFFTNLQTGFRQKRLFAGKYVCVVREDHPAFANGMTVDKFWSVPHAFAESTGMGHAQIYRLLTSQHAVPMRRLCVPQFMALPQVLTRSNLLAIMPKCAAQLLSRSLALKILPLPFRVPDFVIRIYWHDRYNQDAGIVWLRDLFARMIHRESESDKC